MKIIQLEGYTVSPNEQQLYRYTGQDPLTSRAFEVIRLVLEDGSEGVAGSSTGWFGAQRGLVTDQIEDLALSYPVDFSLIGKTGGSQFKVSINGQEYIKQDIESAKEIWKTSLGRYAGQTT